MLRRSERRGDVSNQIGDQSEEESGRGRGGRREGGPRGNRSSHCRRKRSSRRESKKETQNRGGWQRGGREVSKIVDISNSTYILDSYIEHEVYCDDQLAIVGDLAIWTAGGVCNLCFLISYEWECSQVRGTETGSWSKPHFQKLLKTYVILAGLGRQSRNDPCAGFGTPDARTPSNIFDHILLMILSVCGSSG